MSVCTDLHYKIAIISNYFSTLLKKYEISASRVLTNTAPFNQTVYDPK